MANVSLEITRKQKRFIESTASEVLFGGAAGGGKSYGQTVDAFLFALKYPGSKQLLLRRTFAELDKSLIRTVLGWYPRELFTYNSSNHSGKFANGSILDFGYCASENDVNQYQSAEYDVIRFDELTHFTEYQYIYLISRVRGTNGFPKQIKCSTNPGSVGHTWVKRRFVDPAPANTEFCGEDGMTRIFIPSLLTDNKFLMEGDPNYKKRLEALSERDKQALLYGNWDIFEGQYFDEFDRRIHVCKPFVIPKEWRRYISIDYGLDMLAAYWYAVDSGNNVYVYREFCQSNLPIAEAARAVLDNTIEGEDIYAVLAPPDLWGRSQETGKSKFNLFYEAGLTLTKSNNDREAGWLAVKELLRQREDGTARLQIFDTCTELIRCLPALQRDDKRPTDTANEPHELTHSPDSLRYFSIYWVSPNKEQEAKRVYYRRDMLEDYRSADEKTRAQIERIMGGKPSNDH
jgi:hypothetical protein